MAKVNEFIAYLRMHVPDQDFDTLREANRFIVEACRTKERVDANSYRKGERVSFKMKSGKTQFAIVQKVNARTVQCEAEDERTEAEKKSNNFYLPRSWNVPAHMLTRAPKE